MDFGFVVLGNTFGNFLRLFPPSLRDHTLQLHTAPPITAPHHFHNIHSVKYRSSIWLNFVAKFHKHPTLSKGKYSKQYELGISGSMVS